MPDEPADDAGFDASGGEELDFGDPSGGDEPPVDDKPFDDEPFDAGIEADEESDPKKYIEQLSGKLGQSLRDYTEEQGQPDFELEKFAINSVISATHTAEMEEEDKDDIIKQINTSGDDDDDGNNGDGSDMGGDNGDDNPFGDDNGGEPDDEFGGEGDEDLEEIHFLEEKLNNLFLDKPKKVNMFQLGNLGNLEIKEGTLTKKVLLKKLHETFNQEEKEDGEIEHIVKPITPTRKNKCFIGVGQKELEEERGGGSYQVYHNDFDSALKTVSEFLAKKGLETDEKEIQKIESMEPEEGGTQTYEISTYENGVKQDEKCKIDISNVGNKYELNMYFD